MSFYEEIAKYYDYIFPVGNDQIKFLVKEVGSPSKDILDIACGSGEYSIQLSSMGHNVTGVDLDSQMIQLLKDKMKGRNLNIETKVANMLELNQELDQKFNLVFCIGNSMVHLDSQKSIGLFLKVAKSLLKDDGKLIIQIINYDRIIMHNVNSLPSIKNEAIDLQFDRFYRYEERENKVYFKTILKVDSIEIENEIALYPLLSVDLRFLLEEAGFKKMNFFGNFKGEAYDRNSSYALVVVAS